MPEYEASAKKLLSVCQRLENWFSGEKLYETVETQSDDELSIIYRWQYRYGKFEYWDEETQQWRRVINLNRPYIMANFILQVPELHRQARQRKEDIGGLLREAADAGEQYLQHLSGFDSDFAEEETSDYVEIITSVQ